MYKHIIDPKTGKNISVASLKGKTLLLEYFAYSGTNSKSMVGGGEPWYCEMCSYINESNVFTCEMCNSIRKLSWQCPKCSFINACGRSKCKICSFIKPNNEDKITTLIRHAKITRLKQQQTIDLKKRNASKKSPARRSASKKSPARRSASKKSPARRSASKKSPLIHNTPINITQIELSKFPHNIEYKTIRRLNTLLPIMTKADEDLSLHKSQMINPIEIDNFQLSYYELPMVQDYVSNLSHSVSHWIKTRGDGNCYYTSFAFGLLNFMISPQSTLAFNKRILKIFESTVTTYGTSGKLNFEKLISIKCDTIYFNEINWNRNLIASYTRIIAVLKKIILKKINRNNILKLMQEEIKVSHTNGKENITFGIAIVMFLRAIVFEYLRKDINKTRLVEGIPFEQIIEGSYSTLLTETKQMGKEADLNISLCLSYIFRISIQIHQLYTGNQKKNKPKIHSFSNGNMIDNTKMDNAQIHISFRKGHYDGLIPGRGVFTPDLNKAKKILVDIRKKN